MRLPAAESGPSRRLVIPAALVVAMAGCGGSTVSARKAEVLVKRSLDQPSTSVNCPNGVAIKKGRSFDCNIGFRNGDTAIVRLHETNNTGEVSASAKDFKVTTIGGAAARQVVLSWAANRKVGLASVSCPAGSPATVGRSIPCEAADRAGKKATISLEVVNTTGRMRVSHVRPHG